MTTVASLSDTRHHVLRIYKSYIYILCTYFIACCIMLLSSFIEDPNHPQLLLCTLLSFCESYLTCPNSTSTLPSLRNGADRGTFLIIFANSSDATSNIQTAQRPLDANQLTATYCYGLLRTVAIRYDTLRYLFWSLFLRETRHNNAPRPPASCRYAARFLGAQPAHGASKMSTGTVGIGWL